jgi:phosphate:Na+ symporter
MLNQNLTLLGISLLAGLSFLIVGLLMLTDSLKRIGGTSMRTLLQKTTSNRFKGVFAGALVTALVQSASVSTVLVVGFISAGMMELRQAAGFIMGASNGTCITAWIAAMGKATDAKRAALIHVLFNVAGVAVWIGFTDELAMLATWLTREAGLSGIRDVGNLIPREIANAHTIFNGVNTLLFIG